MAENADKVREYQKLYYERGGKERAAAWREANPHKVRLRNLKRRAIGDISEEVITQMVVDQHGLCAYCESDLLGEWEVDHMLPSSRGGTNDWFNLAITCGPCNRRKSAKTVEEFFALER